MQVKIELDDAQLRAKLRELIRTGQDLSDITVAISEKLKAITDSAFKNEKDPTTGKAWAALSPVTLALRRKRGISSTRKLQASRNLLDSIVPDHGKDFAQVGTNLKYAAIQHYGAERGSSGTGEWKTRKGSFPIPWGDIPARPYLGLSKQHEEQIRAIVSEKIRRIISA